MTSWLAHYGVVAIFLLMMLDAVFPAASELVMVYGGALASGALAHEVDVLGWHGSGFSAYVAVVLAGIAGYQVGAIAGWWIGFRGGRAFVERYGRWVHLSPERLERAERWFERWDAWAVLVGRVTPVARSFVSIPAGLFESPFGRYNLLTLLGNGVWCAVLAAIGWGLGSSWDTFHHDFRWVEYAVVAGIVATAAYWIWRRRRTATLPTHGDPSR
ncbi:MAG TPA: DedA family protein [Gaiellaceae bacterium]|jgi:membrane protein DedA with SNARE-associated domain